MTYISIHKPAADVFIVLPLSWLTILQCLTEILQTRASIENVCSVNFSLEIANVIKSISIGYHRDICIDFAYNVFFRPRFCGRYYHFCVIFCRTDSGKFCTAKMQKYGQCCQIYFENYSLNWRWWHFINEEI